MREILFRGKKHDGTWAYGSLIHADAYCCILEDEDNVHPMDYPYLDYEWGTFDGKATPVDFKTVGQYIGKVDKNGTKIFEGDVIESMFKSENSIVMYESSEFKMCDYDIGYGTFFPPTKRCDYLEVIGNIHDNPELMK